MATYSAGNETKRKIIEAARALFYQHGFHDTTYAQVSKVAGVNLGTIVYHYKSLDNLADIIYKDIVNERKEIYMQKLERYFGKNAFKRSTITFAQYRVNTQSYLDYPNYSRFVSERMLKSTTWESPAFDYSLYDICRDYKLDITKTEYVLQKYQFLPFAAIATTAVNNGAIDMSAKELCDYTFKIRLHSYGMKEEDIEQLLKDTDTIGNAIKLNIDGHMNFY